MITKHIMIANVCDLKIKDWNIVVLLFQSKIIYIIV